MDIRPWRDTLDAMTQPDGWIGRRDGKADRAYESLAGYEQLNGWIGHGIPADMVRAADGKDQASKPDAAYAAELRRDAVLQLAVLHELDAWAAHRPAHVRDDATTLAKVLVQAALTAPNGLRAKQAEPQGPKPYVEVDFAHGANAKNFFEETVRPRLLRIDASMGAGLAVHVPGRYEPDNESSILQWGRVWTAGAALVPLDWARSNGCVTARDIGRTIWCGTDPAGHPLDRFYPRAALIPTARKLALTAHAELRTRAAVAYAFAGSEEIRALDRDAPQSLTFALKAMYSRRVGSETRYDGYNGTHLYLAVWSDCLRAANGSRPMAEPGQAPMEPAGADAFGALAPEQRAALAQTTTARKNLQAMSKAMAGARRLSPIRKASPSVVPLGPGTAAGTTFEWEPVSHKSLRFLPVHGAPGRRWQPIGTIDLWRELGAEVEWVDLLVVARIGERQVLLPVTMDDESVEESADERKLLVLDEGSNVPVSADALRRAFEGTDTVVGVVVRKGLGAFVVLEVDMNAQPGAGGA